MWGSIRRRIVHMVMSPMTSQSRREGRRSIRSIRSSLFLFSYSFLFLPPPLFLLLLFPPLLLLPPLVVLFPLFLMCTLYRRVFRMLSYGTFGARRPRTWPTLEKASGRYIYTFFPFHFTLFPPSFSFLLEICMCGGCSSICPCSPCCEL